MSQAPTTQPTYVKGLENVIANQTRLCFIDGKRSKLLYLGYDIADLAEHSNFEEVAFLLWNYRLPKKSEYDEFVKAIRAEYEIPDQLVTVMKLMPKDSDPMDVLRTSVSFLGLFDPERNDNSLEANRRKALRLTAKFPTIVAAWEQIRNGKEPVKPNKEFNIATNFLYMLKGEKPDELYAKIMDVALILHAEHEMNASTFSARVTISTLTDMYSAVTSAIGTLKGPLHGGANREVMKYLLEIGDLSKVDDFVQKPMLSRNQHWAIHLSHQIPLPKALQSLRTSHTTWYYQAFHQASSNISSISKPLDPLTYKLCVQIPQVFSSLQSLSAQNHQPSKDHRSQANTS